MTSADAPGSKAARARQLAADAKAVRNNLRSRIGDVRGDDAPHVGRLRVAVLGAGDRPQVLDEWNRQRAMVEELVDVAVVDFDGAVNIDESEADFVLVLGGDGSILRAARQMGEHQLPVLGLNLGKLGFLAGINPDQLSAVLPLIVSGECRIVEHLMFQCSLWVQGELVERRLGLNEIVIHAGPPFSLLRVHLSVDGELATTYSCDGLIVSTPIGSTAHSLSAGGPILRQDLQAFVICPISPHTLTVRPVIDSADRIYEMTVSSPNPGTTLVVDGRPMGAITAESMVRVERAKPKFSMLEVKSHNYYRTLRDKLGWAGTITELRS